MAAIKYSSTVDEIRGKLGNAIFQRMGRSLGIRNSPYVNYSNNQDALLNRSGFSQVAAAWQALSVAQKDMWVTVSSSYPATDKFGNTIVLTGYQVFMQVNLMLLSAGLPFVAAAYFYGQLIQPNFVDDTIDVSSLDYSITVVSNIYVPSRVLVYSSEMYCSCSIDRNPKVKLARVFDATTGAPMNLYSDLQAVCSAPIVAGKSIYVEIWLIDGNTGIFGLVWKGFKLTVP